MGVWYAMWLFFNCYSVCKLYWVTWGRLLSVWFVTCDCSLTGILYVPVSYFELPEASCWVSGSWGPGPGAGCSTWSTSHTGCERCQGRPLHPCMVHCSEGHWPPAARSRTGIYKTEGVQRVVSKETEGQSSYRGIYRNRRSIVHEQITNHVWTWDTNIKSYYQSMVTYLSRRLMLRDTNILYSWKRGFPIIFCWSRSSDLVLNSLNKKMRDMCMCTCTSTPSNFFAKTSSNLIHGL